MTSCALSVALLARGAPIVDMKLSIARRSGSFAALGALFEDGETGPSRPGFLDAGICSLLARFQENLKYNLIDSSPHVGHHVLVPTRRCQWRTRLRKVERAINEIVLKVFLKPSEE